MTNEENNAHSIIKYEIHNRKRTDEARIFIFVLQAVSLIGVAFYLLKCL